MSVKVLDAAGNGSLSDLLFSCFGQKKDLTRFLLQKVDIDFRIQIFSNNLGQVEEAAEEDRFSSKNANNFINRGPLKRGTSLPPTKWRKTSFTTMHLAGKQKSFTEETSLKVITSVTNIGGQGGYGVVSPWSSWVII